MQINIWFWPPTVILLIFSCSMLIAQIKVSALVKSNFENASILIDGNDTFSKTPALVQISIGKHRISLKYYDVMLNCEYLIEQDIVINSINDTIDINFQPVSINFSCSQEQTDIYINGFFKGLANNLTINGIIPGKHLVKLVQPYGINAEKRIIVSQDNQTNIVDCFHFGNLRIESVEIEGAKIFLNERPTNKFIPTEFNDLIIGDYKITVALAGKTYIKTVLVKNGQTTIVPFNPKAEKESHDSLAFYQKKLQDSLDYLKWQLDAPKRKIKLISLTNEVFLGFFIGGGLILMYFAYLKQ